MLWNRRFIYSNNNDNTKPCHKVADKKEEKKKKKEEDEDEEIKPLWWEVA